MTLRYQVFLSSTYEDLKSERLAVMQAALTQECIPVGMEHVGARNYKSWPLIQELLEESDFCVVLLGNRYGEIVEKNKSFTELEYDFAEQHAKPRIVIVRNVLNPDPTQTPEQIEALQKFHTRLLADRSVAFWTTESELQFKVSNSLHMLRQENVARTRSGGWVKADTFFAKTISNKGAYLVHVVECLAVARRQVIFSFPPRPSRWVFDIIPALYDCLRRGVTIAFFVEISSYQDAYDHMERMGCLVSRYDHKPRGVFSGTIVDWQQSVPGDLLCLSHSASGSNIPYATRIAGRFAASAVSACGRFGEDFIAAQLPADRFRPEIVGLKWEVLKKRLAGVNFYSDSDIDYVPEIPLDRIDPITPVILEVKYAQVATLALEYQKRGLVPFSPAAINLKDSLKTALLPPVLEEIDGRYRVAEGHTRLFYLINKNSGHAPAFVIRDVNVAPNSPVSSWGRVRIANSRPEEGDNELARNIESKVHESFITLQEIEDS